MVAAIQQTLKKDKKEMKGKFWERRSWNNKLLTFSKSAMSPNFKEVEADASAPCKERK